MNKAEARAISEMARILKNAGNMQKNNYAVLRGGLINFVAKDHWRRFNSLDDSWEYEKFEDFCAQWLNMPCDKIEKLFTGETDIIAIINKAKLNPDGTKSTRQIAKETGQSQSTVQAQVSGVHRSDRKVLQYKISQYTTAETAAQKIRAKFGPAFARELAHALTE